MLLSKRSFGRIVMVGVTTAALGVGVADAADAATVYRQTAHETSTVPKLDGNCDVVQESGYPGGGGVACFKPYGDHWFIKDQAADGAYVEVEGTAQWNTSVHFVCGDHAGKAAGWTVCDFASQVRENSNIVWDVAVYKGGKLVSTSDHKVSHTS